MLHNTVSRGFYAYKPAISPCFKGRDPDIQLGDSIVREIRNYGFKSGSRMRTKAEERKNPGYLKVSGRFYEGLDKVRREHYPGTPLSFQEFGRKIDPHIIRGGYANCNEQAFMAAKRLEERGKKPQVICLTYKSKNPPPDSMLYPKETHYFAVFNCDGPEDFKKNPAKAIVVDPWYGFCKRGNEAMSEYLSPENYDPQEDEITWTSGNDYVWDAEPYFPDN